MGGHLNTTGKILAGSMAANALAGGSEWKGAGCFMMLWTLFVLVAVGGGILWFIYHLIF